MLLVNKIYVIPLLPIICKIYVIPLLFKNSQCAEIGKCTIFTIGENFAYCTAWKKLYGSCPKQHGLSIKLVCLDRGGL